MRLILALAACVAVSACIGPTTEPARAPVAIPAPVIEPAPSDACGAGGRANWVGRARADLPAPPHGANWRIYTLGDALNEDLRMDRLNVEIDPGTQKVARLWCG